MGVGSLVALVQARGRLLVAAGVDRVEAGQVQVLATGAVDAVEGVVLRCVGGLLHVLQAALNAAVARLLVGLDDLFGEAAIAQAIAPVAPFDCGVDGGLQEQVNADALAVQPGYQELELREGKATILKIRRKC